MARMKQLSELLVTIGEECAQEVCINGLSDHTANVKPGDLFFAIPSVNKGKDFVDGRAFITDAIAKGAAAVLFEATQMQDGWLPQTTVPLIPIRELRNKISRIASCYYDYPSRRAKVIGVTGTNGKTSTVHGLVQVLNHAGIKAVSIGTLGYGNGKLFKKIQHNNTTPGALLLQQLINHAVSNDSAQVVVLEVSSHALDQGRVSGVEFDVAVFTNLSQDHLDYHGTMQAYLQAKLRLFTSPELKFAVVNEDDGTAEQIDSVLSSSVKLYSYSTQPPKLRPFCRNAVHITNLDMHGAGLQFTIMDNEPVDIRSRLVGHFNVENILAIYQTCRALGVPLSRIATGISLMTAGPGRMERWHTGSFPQVVIDFAHSPDALSNALTAVKTHARRQVWVVFGCGGDRDKQKRPMMGKIACALADKVIITSDNPRNERAEDIAIDILSECQDANNVQVIIDRKSAIRHAIEHALADDIILIAGKGHENTQQIGEELLPYSDQEVVKGMLHVKV